MHRILVTGSNGQLGSEIRELTKNDGTNVYFYTDVSELDITDKSAVNKFIENQQIDIVVNCAAYTQVDKAEEEEKTAFLINATAPGNLAEACKKYDATLFHISTDYVFDGSNNVPYIETESTSPLGVYGRSKLEGEEFIQQSGCNYLIIRTSWLYSSFGNNFVKTIARLSSEKDELKVVFDQIGTPTYARDLATVIFAIIQNDQFKDRKGVYHYSNEGVCSWYDFAKAINDLFGNNCNIIPCHSDEFPAKVPRPHYSVLDKTNIKNDFSIEIGYWKDSLCKCVELLKQNNS
ncbi:MAG: dTDP-4-dehydrorhamnose reductase [Clostridiaceae bacterium]|nr:dTDP-4-dehydrorhamnose reductase [Clostridiaceae bacterium]